MTTRELEGIARTYSMLTAEVGHAAAAMSVHNVFFESAGHEETSRVLLENRRLFPVLSSIGAFTAGQIAAGVAEANEALERTLAGKDTIVCIGAEAAIIDALASRLSQREIYIVPHSPVANRERILSNYGANVRIHSSIELEELSGTGSVIVIAGYGFSGEIFHTYPIAHRICGADTRQLFSKIIAMDIFGTRLHAHPGDLTGIPSRVATDFLHGTLI